MYTGFTSKSLSRSKLGTIHRWTQLQVRKSPTQSTIPSWRLLSLASQHSNLANLETHWQAKLSGPLSWVVNHKRLPRNPRQAKKLTYWLRASASRGALSLKAKVIYSWILCSPQPWKIAHPVISFCSDPNPTADTISSARYTSSMSLRA